MDAKELEALYPLRWAKSPPAEAPTAMQFLEEIGVGTENIDPQGIERCHEELPTFDELQRKGAVEWDGKARSKEPTPGFRMTPEWEPMTGVLLNWPVFYPPLWDTYRQFVIALDHTTTILRMPEGYLGAAVMAWLKAKGLNMTKIRPVPGPIGDIWPRDYSAVYGTNVHTGEAIANKFVFPAFFPGYRDIYRSIVEIDNNFAWKEGFSLIRSEIALEGGNLLTDGNGTYVMTRRVLSDNSSIPNLREKLEGWLGAERLILVDEEPEDPLGHIGSFKFVGPEKLVLGRPERKDSSDWRYLDRIRGLFSKLGYDVLEIPIGTDMARIIKCPSLTVPDYPGGYVNSLMINKRLIIPQYDRAGLEEMNVGAIEAYKDALPGYEIVPLEVSLIGNGGGAVNCSSREIPKV